MSDASTLVFVTLIPQGLEIFNLKEKVLGKVSGKVLGFSSYIQKIVKSFPRTIKNLNFFYGSTRVCPTKIFKKRVFAFNKFCNPRL